MACRTSFFNSPRVIITRPDLTAISNMRRNRPGIARPSSSIVRNCSMSIQILKASLVGGSRRTHTVPGRRLRSDGMATSRCPAKAERLASVRSAVNGAKLKLVHQMLYKASRVALKRSRGSVVSDSSTEHRMMIDPRAKLLAILTTRRNTVASHSEPWIAASVSPTSVSWSCTWR
jgi:hypothetical protein